MGRQIQLRIDRIHPTPVRMGIGGTVDPDFSKDRLIGRTFRRGSFILHGLPRFRTRGMAGFIAAA